MRYRQTPSERYAPRLGQRVGLLTFVAIIPELDRSGHVVGEFRCDCGNTVRHAVTRILTSKKIDHCGCQTDWSFNRTHGMKHSREYNSWAQMKARCFDINHSDYPRYGGRGITVCAEWVSSFESFYGYVGARPANTTLDRIDNQKGYEPGNVRWATAKQQARNQRSSCRWHIKGMVFEAAVDAAEHFGVSVSTIRRWAQGKHDPRRGTFTPALEDCHVVSLY